MKISAIMKQSPVCVLPSDSLEMAAKKMLEYECGILPVVEVGEEQFPVGVITDRDIVTRCIAVGRDPRVMTVGDACTTPATCCNDDCTAEDAFHTMRDHRIGRLPVIDNNGVLVGIVSMADIITRDPAKIWDQLPGAEKPLPRQKAA